MPHVRQILTNTAALSVTGAAGQLANFFLVISFARAFGVTVLGYYSISMAVGAVAMLLVSLGTVALLTRELSVNPACAPERLGVLLPIQLILAVVAWVAACVLSIVLIGDTAAIAVVTAICGYQIALRLATLLLVPLNASQLMHVSAGGDFLHRVLSLLLALTAIWVGASAGIVALAPVAGAAGLMIFAWIQTSRRFGRPRLRFAPLEALSLFSRSFTFFGLTAMSVLYSRGAMLALSALAAPHAVGLYAVADRSLAAANLGPKMFNTAVYPALTRVTRKSPADAQALTTRCLRLVWVGAFPLAALIAIFARDIVELLFGTQYLGAEQALRVLVWTLPIGGAQALLSSQLAALEMEFSLARARFAALCTFALLAPGLILWLGFVGAAWAVLLGAVIQFALDWALLARARVAPAVKLSLFAPALVAALVTSAGMMLSGVPLVPRVIIVTLAMLTGMWVFRAVRLHDLRFLREMFSGKAVAPPN